MGPETIYAARSAIGRCTPMHSDCGSLCDHACCRPDDDGKGGVYLFPEEMELLRDASWGHIVDTPFAPMLLCDGPCVRARRPLACRIFPLTPRPAANGTWQAAIDRRARPVCPLTRSTKELRPDFVRAVQKALEVIARDPEGNAFLQKWARLESEYDFDLGRNEL